MRRGRVDRRLFDREFFAALAWIRRVQVELRQRPYGEAESRRRGGQRDFHGHRQYEIGDDFRYIDWNVYGRLGRLVVKEFTREESGDLRILLDDSASMRFGSPSKWDTVRRLAALVAVRAVLAGGRVTIAPFSRDAAEVWRGGGWHEQVVPDLLGYLAARRADGGPGIDRAIGGGRRGEGEEDLLILSDLWEEVPPGGFWRRATVGAGRWGVVRLLTPFERDPSIEGGWGLLDLEREGEASLAVQGGESLRAVYRERFEERERAWSGPIRATGGGFASVDIRSDLPHLFERTIEVWGAA